MTPDECFNEMAKVLGFPKPDETGYIAILEKVKELQEKNDDLENKVLHLESEIDDMETKYNRAKSGTLLSFQEVEIEDLKEENMELTEKNKSLNNDILEIGAELNKRCEGEIMFHQTPDGDNCLIEIHSKVDDNESKVDMEAFKKLQKENMELSKKSNAKSDIIRNMFDFITEYPEEVQEGFTFKRGWGHKYIDEWNKIVTDEFKEVVKDINENLGDEMEWKTDGYEFSLHIKEEEEEAEEEEEEVQGSN